MEMAQPLIADPLRHCIVFRYSYVAAMMMMRLKMSLPGPKSLLEK